MQRPSRIVALAVFSVVAVTANAAGWVVERWAASSEPRKFSKVLVVGITSDAAARRSFENKLVSHLRGRGYECVTSYSLEPDLANIGPPAEVADKLLAGAVDAVVTVRLAAADAYEGPEGSAKWQGELTSETRARDYVETALAAGGEKSSDKRAVEVGVWDMASRGRIWGARTAPHELSKLRKRSGDIMQEVILLMRDDGVL
jgi:hypothetical protein